MSDSFGPDAPFSEVSDAPSSEVDSVYRPTACAACEKRIDPDDRRLTWRVQKADVFYRFHYCSEACLPGEPPTP